MHGACRSVIAVFVGALVLHQMARVGLAEPPAGGGPAPKMVWHEDYAQAMSQAEQQGKMLLVWFRQPGEEGANDAFEAEVFQAESVCRQLRQWVCVRLATDVTISVGGKETTVLGHAAFSELKNGAGMAILDFAHSGAEYFGCVVSTIPWSDCREFSVRQMEMVLDLPPGRPEQREEVFAARKAAGAEPAIAAEDPCDEDDDAPRVDWMSDYAEAMTAAEHRNRMLLIYFCDPDGNEPCNRFRVETLDNGRVRRKLQDYVCVQLPLDATITVDGESVRLVEHAAYREMLGRPGIAMVDYRSSDVRLRGSVVSIFPITEKLWYTPERMAVILDLPPGTLTQRTLIYAVRIHPERPASADSEASCELLKEAESHSEYQATIRLQGHHRWGSRFRRIVARLPGGLSAREVCAESWPGENLVEAAIECVRCWRLSDGHWGAVRAGNRCFGYDMKRGSNGVWYATGIFGAR